MPRMTGTEAIYYIREHEKAEGMHRVPVVAISGNVQPAEQASYFQAGMDGFLAKPFKRDEFLRMLNKYKPKPYSTPSSTPTQTPPVMRRANSAATVTAQPSSTPVQSSKEHPPNYPQTAPPAQTSRSRHSKAPSPVPFVAVQSEPDPPTNHEVNATAPHRIPQIGVQTYRHLLLPTILFLSIALQL